MMRQGISTVIVMALCIAVPAAAQQGRGGTAVARSCEGCDSAQLAAARRRWVDSEIAALTMEVARNRILYENLKSRLAPDSPEPPRSEREKVELQARLMAQSREMERLMRDLSQRCGEQEPVRGYIGVVVGTSMVSEEASNGRITTGVGYSVVQSVEPGSPAARAGIAVSDTIIAINRSDARGRSFEPFVREPGEKLSVTVGRDGVRRDVTVTVGSRPPTFGGSCMQYRDFRFTDASGQNVVMVRKPGTGSGGVAGPRSGGPSSGGMGQGRVSVRTPVSVEGPGARPVQVFLPRDSSDESPFILLPPAGANGALFIPRGGTGALVAGAEVSLINGGLKAIFAVDYGALVLNVAPRSPAQQAGLVEGDVIVRANGAAITAIAVLQQQIRDARDRRSVSLDVVRAKEPKAITLRW